MEFSVSRARLGIEAGLQCLDVIRAGQADPVRQRQGHGIGIDVQGVGEQGQRQDFATAQVHQHEGPVRGQFDAELAVVAQGWSREVEQFDAQPGGKKVNLLVDRGSVPVGKVEVGG